MITFTFNGIPCTVDGTGLSVNDERHADLVEVARNQVRVLSQTDAYYYPSLETKIIAALRQIGKVKIISGSPAVAREGPIY